LLPQSPYHKPEVSSKINVGSELGTEYPGSKGPKVIGFTQATILNDVEFLHLYTGSAMLSRKLICSVGMMALSRSINSSGCSPIHFSKSPCEKNSE